MPSDQPPDLNLGNEFKDERIIDCDVHPTYNSPIIRKALAERMAEPFSSYLDPESGSTASPYPSDGWPKDMGGNRSGVWLTELTDGGDIQEKYLNQGVDYAIIDQLAPLDQVRETDRAMEEMRAANDVLVERYLDGYDNLFGLLNIAARQPEKAAEEIHRLGEEEQIVGIVLLPGAEYQKPLGDPRYDVIYRAAEEQDLTIYIHAVDGFLPHRHAPVLNDFERFVSMHVLGFPWSAMMTMTSLIVQGIPEKFPNLNFVMTEAGVGWIPYTIGRLNNEIRWRKSEAPLLNKSPEEYIRESFYFGTQPLEAPNDRSHLLESLRMVGADNLVFTSDYPHWDFDNPATTNNVFAQAFSTEERRQILYDNPIEAFDLPV